MIDYDVGVSQAASYVVKKLSQTIPMKTDGKWFNSRSAKRR